MPRARSVGRPKKRTSSSTESETRSKSPVKEKTNKCEWTSTNFHVARNKLHTSTVPENLPCREKEYEEIYKFLRSHIEEQISGCMYISGVPGTGKTATVYDVVRALQGEFVCDDYTGHSDRKKRARKKLAASVERRFTFIEINGLRLTEPHQFYVELYKKLVGDTKRISVASAKDYISKYFSEPETKHQQRRPFIVLLVDELDLLCTRKQQILYHLFNWPSNSEVKLAVVAIANTMDLPERVMISRVSSRLGLNRITFQPYSHEELKQIIESRITDMKIFDEPAVKLIARKVASVSGDARKALDLCRKAVLMAEMACKKDPKRRTLVTVDDVQDALIALSSTVKATAIREASKLEQMFLEAVMSVFHSSGLEEAPFESVAKIHQSMSYMEGVHKCSITEIFHIAFRLYQHRLILLDTAPGCFLSKKIRLNVSKDDIDFGLKMQLDS